MSDRDHETWLIGTPDGVVEAVVSDIPSQNGQPTFPVKPALPCTPGVWYMGGHEVHIYPPKERGTRCGIAAGVAYRAKENHE